MRDGLAYDGRRVPHEDERLPVIEAQVDEVPRRQQAGVLRADLDPQLLRLLGSAVVSYPRMLPQTTRMVTGLARKTRSSKPERPHATKTARAG